MRVAGVALSAQLAQLLGAHAAAAAAVQYQADAGGAARRRGRALTLAAAVLARGGLRREGGGQPGARPSRRRALPFPAESLPIRASRRGGLQALTPLQRAKRSTKAKRTGPRPAADMVGELRAQGRSVRRRRRRRRRGGCGAVGGTVGRLEVGACKRRIVVSGAVGRGGCRRAGGGRSPVVGVALAASSQRGRVVV